jgi:hypothetical protein
LYFQVFCHSNDEKILASRGHSLPRLLSTLPVFTDSPVTSPLRRCSLLSFSTPKKDREKSRDVSREKEALGKPLEQYLVQQPYIVHQIMIFLCG